MLFTTLEENASLAGAPAGLMVKHGPNIQWIDPKKYRTVRQLVTGDNPVVGVRDPQSVVVSVDGQPATLDTPIGQATTEVEIRRHLGRKG